LAGERGADFLIFFRIQGIYCTIFIALSIFFMYYIREKDGVMGHDLAQSSPYSPVFSNEV
jgi:hypothetical protein